MTIWGDYGRVEGSKVFMGVAQILLDNLDLSHIVIGWYKLFGTSSLVNFVLNTLNIHLSNFKGLILQTKYEPFKSSLGQGSPWAQSYG